MLSLLGETGEFLCDLIMTERENDVSQVVEDDFNGRKVDHFFCITAALSSEGCLVT